MHIPKCSGASLRRVLNNNYKDYKVYGGEVCYDRLNEEESKMIKNFNITKNYHIAMVREPIAHVYSQFLECKYDGWGKTVTNKTSFPRNYSDPVGFDKWLDHFNESWHDKLGFFRCYIPFNAQARAFTCTGGNNHILRYRNMKDPLNPDISTAMNNSLEFHFIGITEYFKASLCLLEDRLRGKLNEGCLNLCNNKTIENTTTNYMVNVHEKHNVPEHSVNDLAPSTISKIERITRIDKILYQNLLARFLYEIKTLEAKYQTTLICDT